MAFTVCTVAKRILCLCITLILLPLAVESQSTDSKSIYTGCGETQTCIGVSESGKTCLETKCCHYVVAFHYESKSDHVIVQMQSTKLSNYVSMGISFDVMMGGDAVIQCFRNYRGTITMASSRNEGKSNVPLVTPINFKRIEAKIEDGNLFCEFSLPLEIDTGNEAFNLRLDSYHIIVAGGPVSDDQLSIHSIYGKDISRDKVNFTLIQKTQHASVTDESFKVISIQIHIFGMVFTWMFCIPIGIFTARFFKETWANAHPCGRRIWFISHTSVMLVGLISALLGWVMIPISQGGLLTNNYDQLRIHQILGYCALASLLLECSLNWFHVFEQPWKFIVKKSHVILGILCYAAGLAQIGFSNLIVGSHAPKSLLPLVGAWLVVLIIFFVGMSIYTTWTDKHLGVSAMRTVAYFPMPMTSDEEAPRPKLRKSILGLYALCASVICGFTIYYILLKEDTPCQMMN